MSDAHSIRYERLARRAALASVGVTVLLLVLKGWAAWSSGSVAMLGSLADTGFDLLSSLAMLYAVRLAMMPADEDHRFGHGKAEALVALAQVSLIAVSAAGILLRAVETLRAGSATADPKLSIAVSLLAMGATVALVAYQRHVIAQTGSVAVRANNINFESDLLLNGSVIVALVLEGWAGVRGADPVLGILIALWLARGAWLSAAHAIDQLMDREWPEEKRQRFVALANAQPGFRGIHDLRTRTSGAHDFAQFHAWVDPEMTVAQAHDIVEAAEDALHTAFPGAEVLIHLDPEGRIDRAGRHDETLRETPER